jgi:hypothetical protein
MRSTLVLPQNSKHGPADEVDGSGAAGLPALGEDLLDGPHP